MQRSDDEDILAVASERGYVAITLDADFHALVAVRGRYAPSVIRLRREGCRAESVVAILVPVLERYAGDLEAGVLISVRERRVTRHLLPVGRRL
jgi:predicted nuclease of predicted toxin-antitoxin system